MYFCLNYWAESWETARNYPQVAVPQIVNCNKTTFVHDLVGFLDAVWTIQTVKRLENYPKMEKCMLLIKLTFCLRCINHSCYANWTMKLPTSMRSNSILSWWPTCTKSSIFTLLNVQCIWKHPDNVADIRSTCFAYAQFHRHCHVQYRSAGF